MINVTRDIPVGPNAEFIAPFDGDDSLPRGTCRGRKSHSMRQSIPLKVLLDADS